MSIESAKANQSLVCKTFRDLHQDWGELMDRVVGCENSGYIPLEIPCEFLAERAAELGWAFHEVYPKPAKPGEIFSKIFYLKPLDEKVGTVGPVVVEMEGCLWVSNSDFDNFEEIFMNG